MSPNSTRTRISVALLCVAVSALALLPWWRNHDYLRDFFDYGIYISVNGRLDAGQSLFTDFTTPAQSAAFWLNHVAERLGGRTYVGMTYGAALLIIIAAVGMSLILARRFSPLLACVLAGAIVVCSASQHTIIFYNPLGVLAMALVVWGFAMAPLLRRENAGWHAVAAAGLLLGGLNKLNFHLLACLLAVGWIVWGAIQSRASWRRVLGTVAFVAGCGVLLPLAVELAWTGASWRTWYYNVVELPLRARGGRVALLTDARIYFSTLHDHYGPMRVPQAGLVIIVLPMLAVAAFWWVHRRDHDWTRRWLAILAGFCGGLSGAALLLTNNEIAYLTLAASLVMLSSLWLGFGLPVRGAAPWLILGVPAITLGLCGWDSAWRGQRSQFGHAAHPRSEYPSGESIGPAFGYLRGLKLPPPIAGSLESFAFVRAEMGAAAEQVYYGPGTEWLERIWPVQKVKGLPLVASGFNIDREVESVRRNVIEGGPFRHILVVEAWDWWPPALREPMARSFSMERVGPSFFLYHKLRPRVWWGQSLEFQRSIGGNVDNTRLASNMEVQTLADGRRFAGIMEGEGELELAARVNRGSGEAVIKRVRPDEPFTEPVRFDVYAFDERMQLPRWSQEVRLPDGEDEMVISTGLLDGSGLMLLFTVDVPESMAGKVVAGWRAPRLSDTTDAMKLPPLVQHGSALPLKAGPKYGVLLPAGMEDSDIFLRGTTLREGAFWLQPGDELWIKLNGSFTDIHAIAHAPGAPPGELPQFHTLYYKGGRLEVFHPETDEANNTARVRAWSPESGGWLGFVAFPYSTTPAFTISITSAERP